MDSKIVSVARRVIADNFAGDSDAQELARAVIAMADAVGNAAAALKAVGSCSQCGLGLEIGGQSRHRDCSFDPEKEPIDLDAMVQEAWEACDRLRRSAEWGSDGHTMRARSQHV